MAGIRIGSATNVQDNAVVHCDTGFPLVIGDRVTIGHGAIVHCEEVGDGSLVGIGARVLAHARVGRGCLIGAGAVVPPGLVVPDGTLLLGVPGRVVRPLRPEEREYLRIVPDRYLALARLHHEHPDAAAVQPFGGGAGGSPGDPRPGVP